MTLPRGMVVLLALDPTQGHEQRGVRPALVVSDPQVSSDQRYPMIAVVPLTRTPGRGALYPSLEPGSSGLKVRSHALIDQVRSVDKRRVRAVFGRVTGEEMQRVDQGLALYLGLPAPPAGARPDG
jgi:mRNA interferase MazF